MICWGPSAYTQELAENICRFEAFYWDIAGSLFFATTAVLSNNKTRTVAKAPKEHGQFYPQPRWVGHGPVGVFDITLEIIKTINGLIPKKTIAALDITK